MGVVGFLHTDAVHVATFDRLVREIAPTAAVRTAVDASVLDSARDLGVGNDAVAAKNRDRTRG